jgi:hypothetical protein
LLFLNAGVLFAQPFEDKRLIPCRRTRSGSRPGGCRGWSAMFRLLKPGRWFTGKAAESEGFTILKLPPDGSKAAVVQAQVFAGQAAILVIDLTHGTTSRFMFGSNIDALPVWSPDGSRIAWCSLRGGTAGVYQKGSNGAPTRQCLSHPAGIRQRNQRSQTRKCAGSTWFRTNSLSAGTKPYAPLRM